MQKFSGGGYAAYGTKDMSVWWINYFSGNWSFFLISEREQATFHFHHPERREKAHPHLDSAMMRGEHIAHWDAGCVPGWERNDPHCWFDTLFISISHPGTRPSPSKSTTIYVLSHQQFLETTTCHKATAPSQVNNECSSTVSQHHLWASLCVHHAWTMLMTSHLLLLFVMYASATLSRKGERRRHQSLVDKLLAQGLSLLQSVSPLWSAEGKTYIVWAVDKKEEYLRTPWNKICFLHGKRDSWNKRIFGFYDHDLFVM